MDSVYPLAFHYTQGPCTVARLVNLTLADEPNSARYAISIANDICTKITHTTTNFPGESRLKFISNTTGTSPLLLVIPGTQNKMKFEVDVSHMDRGPDHDACLVIHKSYGELCNSKLLQEQMTTSLASKSGDSSKIPLSALALDDTSKTVIVNDTFDANKAQNTVLNVSVWSHSSSESCLVFSFQLWVQETPSETVSVSSPIPEPTSQCSKHRSSTEIGLQDLRKAFNFNIHDGPEFRTTLAAYEQNCPKLKKAMVKLQEEIRGLDLALKRLLSTRNRVLDTLESLIRFSFSPLLKKLGMFRSFSVAFKRVFEPVERNFTFIIKEVFSEQSMPKMISYCLSSTGPEGSYEAGSSRKSFEKQSKEYYDWLHKYLSNEKDRPESKLLLKRKGFELSKFDYLNALNASSNNQYFNQLLENFFKFSNIPSHDGVLDSHLFKDNKRSQTLLSENASLYLNGLSRFNSEKLQFRQMIEACRTNEELTTLIKSNALNSLSAHQNDAPDGGNNRLLIDTSNVNLDMIFPNSPVNVSPRPEQASSFPWASMDDDQNANFAGILYALGGQGKPGWHKEWVELKKGQLVEYSDWRNGTQPINRPIDIALSSVKPVTKDKRQFCLEIFTSLGQRHVFQAINDDERNQWIKALYNAGQLTDRLIKKANKPKESNAKTKSKHRVTLDLSQPPTQIFPTEDGRGSPVSVFSESFHPSEDNFLQSVRAIEGSENGRCADCKTAESVEWISVTFCVVICVKCSSCHRNMGSHISKVKSLKLDNFVDEARVLLKHTNNALVNSYLEEAAVEKLTPDTSDSQRLQYIRQKYEHRAFMTPATGLNSLLVKATRKIDIAEVIRWLNCGAEPNLWLEMANAESKEPFTVSLFEYSLRKRVEVEEHGLKRDFFVISELLLLHGCKIENIDQLNPQVVGSDEAKAYWRKKRARVMAI
ncbi:hypothetical protein JCM33374_g1017 [Metschnikowia sp. JCM 33374]|nr:hypothetical protein JCM33374_g1017 [Metschnikowia sp. JCM 33374]